MRFWALAAAAAAGGVLALAVVSRGTAAVAYAPQAPTIATCDVIKLSALLMASDKYAKPITEKRDAMQAALKPLEEELQAMGKQLQALGPNPPRTAETESLARRFEERRQMYMQQSEAREREFETFRTRTNFDAYQQVSAATGVVAARRGYALVVANRVLESGKPPENPAVFLQGILARPVVVSPPADDLTAEVMAELKLQEPKPAGAEKPDAPAPAEAPRPVIP